MANVSGCDLHIPHKTLSGDQETMYREDMSEIERWSRRLAKCFGGKGCTCLISQNSVSSFTLPPNTPGTTIVSVAAMTPIVGTFDFTAPPRGVLVVVAGWQLNATGARFLAASGDTVGQVTDAGLTTTMAVDQFQQVDCICQNTGVISYEHDAGVAINLTLNFWFYSLCGCRTGGC